MRFNISTLTTGALALLSAPLALAVEPLEIEASITTLTTKLQALEAPAQSINLINGRLILTGQGPYPKIISGLKDITSNAGTTLATISSSPVITDLDDEQNIFNAFAIFIDAYETLLSVLVGKAPLFASYPYVGSPVAGVLQQCKTAVDAMGLALEALIPDGSSDVLLETAAFNVGVESTIKAYQGGGTEKRGVAFKA